MNECILLWAPLDRDYLPGRVAELPDVRMPIVEFIDDLPRLLPEADAMVMLGHFYTAQSAPVIKAARPEAALDPVDHRRLRQRDHPWRAAGRGGDERRTQPRADGGRARHDAAAGADPPAAGLRQAPGGARVRPRHSAAADHAGGGDGGGDRPRRHRAGNRAARQGIRRACAGRVALRAAGEAGGRGVSRRRTARGAGTGGRRGGRRGADRGDDTG